MKILVLSDLHAERSPFVARSGAHFDVAILAGDILACGREVAPWVRRSSCFDAQPVIHVAGNHEYYNAVLECETREMRLQAEKFGIHFLDCDETVIDGVRFLGCTLWTDFELGIATQASSRAPMRLSSDPQRAMRVAAEGLNEYRIIWREAPQPDGVVNICRLQPMDTVVINLSHKDWLRRKLAEPFVGPTVVITHHAPHRGSLAPNHSADWISGGFVNEMKSEFFDVPVLWVHGHTHHSFDYRVGPCRVVCNPRGYVNAKGDAENPLFDANMIVEI